MKSASHLFLTFLWWLLIMARGQTNVSENKSTNSLFNLALKSRSTLNKHSLFASALMVNYIPGVRTATLNAADKQKFGKAPKNELPEKSVVKLKNQ